MAFSKTSLGVTVLGFNYGLTQQDKKRDNKIWNWQNIAASEWHVQPFLLDLRIKDTLFMDFYFI